MKIGITPFIAQNIAPPNVSGLAIFDGDKKICDVDISKMQMPKTEEKLYSFGLVSDMHLYSSELSWYGNQKFDNALTHFENQNCVLCAHAGDITQSGFFDDGNESSFAPGQFAKYKEILNKHNIPVYGICGNHESYVKPITNNLTELRTYTGTDLYYTVMQENDLFIFVGQAEETIPMSDDALQWLYETLEVNRNKRCFVFVHPHLSSGNPLGAYASNNLFGNWGTKTTAFKNLLSHYKNTILFHGHSHTKFECQSLDKKANYNAADGFRSVHVPSLGRPREIVDGVLSGYLNSDSEGYVVDVYANHIVLKGYDFIASDIVPIAQYCIDTTVQMIPAGTFTDPTGTIVT